MNKNPQQDLIDQVKAWIEGNIDQTYRYAYFLCRDRSLAEDIAHDACVKIFKSRPTDEDATMLDSNESELVSEGSEGIDVPVDKSQAYARRCVFNAYADYLRAPKERTGRSEAVLPDDEGHRVFRIADRVGETISSQSLQDALLKLNEEDRTLIFLRYYLGFGVADAVQEATGLTGGAVYRRHTKVLKQLRKILSTTEEAVIEC